MPVGGLLDVDQWVLTVVNRHFGRSDQSALGHEHLADVVEDSLDVVPIHLTTGQVEVTPDVLEALPDGIQDEVALDVA